MADSKRIAIMGGTLIDGTGTAPRSNPGLYIEGNTIRKVGTLNEDESRDWSTAQVVDASGQYIMPGLIDAHCHMSLHQGSLPGVKFPSSAEFCTLWAGRNATQVLHAGVTGISVPGGKWFADVAVRDSINGGLLKGPRMFVAGRGLTPYGGIFDQTSAWSPAMGDTSGPTASAGVICNTIDEFVTEVRRQSKYGVDMIKVADSYWGDIQTVSQAELRAVVEEAHRRNLKVSIHARGSGSTRDSAKAGVDWIFHADWATDEDLDAVAEGGMPIVPAFTSPAIAVKFGGEMGFSEKMRDRLKRQLDINYRAIQKARDRGIRILAGTDSGNVAAYGHGRWHGLELEIFVKEIGMSPMEAIMAATSLNAVTIGLEGKTGAIRDGMLADIIIWDGDPVADISILHKPEHLTLVMKDGGIVDRTTEGYLPLKNEPPRAH
ncbi:amidohydrolase family protein [Rhizobium puerariae]|uniref:Amidohydrolase family protein n=1 Tax=Rhizobium puerariae TaxID=1585791 RepID=A0ABV6AA01_9HYPH